MFKSSIKKAVLLRNIKVTLFCLMIATLVATAFFLLSHSTANMAIIYSAYCLLMLCSPTLIWP